MKMNSLQILFTFIVALALGLTSASAQKKATVHGEIVELMSYVKDGVKPISPAKKEVVMENFRKGGTLAIIDNSNKLYLIATSPTDTAFAKNVTPYLGVKSFIKGPVYSRNGVRLIVLEDIGKSIK